jgi:hypothetical protein
MSRSNPTAPPRGGFDYQDLWGLALCLEVLKPPKEYDWVQFETTLEEAPKIFCLDDIVLRRKNGKYVLNQIKHRVNPARDPWTWESLLAKDVDAAKKPKLSLIQRWNASISKPDFSISLESARFLTDGIPDSDLERSLKDQRINVDFLKEILPDVFNTLVEQLGGEDTLRSFAAKFIFLFSQPAYDALADRTYKEFNKMLGATKAGIDNLLLEIKKECRKQHTNPWDVESIRSKCEFSNPRPLNEEFAVPPDFQLFNPAQHLSLINKLATPEGGIQVIYGNPGSGKSTYLSWLVKEIKKQDLTVLRHHYHINPDDLNPQERVSSKRAIEALKAQCREQPQLLGALEFRDANSVSLRDFLGQVASELRRIGKAAVLIIDGLDHALRHADKEELSDLLNEACVPQGGIWIVLGTQLTAKSHLPQIVFDKCPEAQWIEVTALGRTAVQSIIEANEVNLSLPSHPQQKTGLVDAVNRLSSGNPLHVRYTLNALARISQGSVATEFDCNDLVPYDGNIERYYDALWRKLPPIAKSLVLVFSCAPFEPTETDLAGISDIMKYSPTETSNAISAIYHLLQNRHGHLSIYHNSFREFLTRTSEAAQQNLILKRHLREWINQGQSDELKWAHLRMLDCELGTPGPLMDIDRKWVLEAFAHPRPVHQIIRQLEAAAEYAFKQHLWGAAIKYSTLQNYVSNVTGYYWENFAPLWNLAYKINPTTLPQHLESLSHDQIATVCREADRRGLLGQMVRDALSIVNEQHHDQRITPRGEISGSMPNIRISTLDIVALDDQQPLSRILTYIRSMRPYGWAPYLIGHFAERLIERTQIPKLKSLAASLEGAEETYIFSSVCADHALTSASQDLIEILIALVPDNLHPMAIIALEFNGHAVLRIPHPTPHAALPATVPEYDSGHSDHRANAFYEGFLIGLICGLKGDSTIVDEWDAQREDNWPQLAYSLLAKAGTALGRDLQQHRCISINTPVDSLRDLPVLKWPDDRDRLEWQQSLELGLSKITRAALFIEFARQGCPRTLSDSEIDALNQSVHFRTSKLVRLLDLLQIPVLTPQQLQAIVSKQNDEIRRSGNTFIERSERTLELARIVHYHNDLNLTKSLIAKTADYLLAYGSHKDLFLDQVMDSVKIAHQGIPQKTQQHLVVLAPLALTIQDYTDGDETRHFPESLAEVVEATRTELLPGYFLDEANKENYHLADKIFERIITSADLSNQSLFYVATTAIDSASFTALQKRAESEPRATEAVLSIEDYFGPLRFEVENPSSSTIGRKPQSFSDVAPEHVTQKLSTLGSPWDKSEFLQGWAQYWLDNAPQRADAIFQIMDQYVRDSPITRIEANTLDLLAKLALSRNREKAFHYITWAQANGNGWEPYLYPRASAFWRWQFVKDNFPERYLEFFELSVERSGLRFGRNPAYFVSVPRAPDFFAFFGKWDCVDDIVTSAVDLAKSLVVDAPNISIPWISDGLYDGFDLLLHRLIWPSPLVQERAARSLGLLLSDSRHQITAKVRLLKWISEQKLESVALNGVIAFAHAVSLMGADSFCFQTKEIVAALQTSSIAIDLVLDYIAARLKDVLPTTKSYPPLISAPAAYIPDPFFQKHLRSFLPPIYSDHAHTIEARSKAPFMRDWAYTADALRRDIGIANDADPLDYMGRSGKLVLMAMTTKLSEVYRSAYLRCIQGYHLSGIISESFFMQYALRTIPIDFSIWRTLPNRMPPWWPGRTSSIGAPVDSLTAISYESEAREVIKGNTNGKIIALYGATTLSSPAVTSRIKLLAFGYRVVGREIPSPERVMDHLSNTRCELTPPSKLKLPVSHLESYADHVPEEMDEQRIGDVYIVPLTGHFCILSPVTWQWFRRRFGAPFGPNRLVFPNIKIVNEDRRWAFIEGDSIIAASYDWTAGVTDRIKQPANPPAGHYLSMENDYLENFLRENELRLGFVLSVDVGVQEGRYVKTVREFSTCKFLQFSPIITMSDRVKSFFSFLRSPREV